jgi:hypothetical protein
VCVCVCVCVSVRERKRKRECVCVCVCVCKHVHTWLFIPPQAQNLVIYWGLLVRTWYLMLLEHLFTPACDTVKVIITYLAKYTSLYFHLNTSYKNKTKNNLDGKNWQRSTKQRQYLNGVKIAANNIVSCFSNRNCNHLLNYGYIM